MEDNISLKEFFTLRIDGIEAISKERLNGINQRFEQNTEALILKTESVKQEINVLSKEQDRIYLQLDSLKNSRGNISGASSVYKTWLPILISSGISFIAALIVAHYIH